ncbi:MAG TPA: hypothetical protein VK548_06075 [Candidatus Acidoferrum sp.]|nr:hypothetical protein [Candidatus Acidoferrum sp.]
MAEPNLYEQLKKVLEDFKKFLDENVTKIRPAIQALGVLIPPLPGLIDKLIALMGTLKTEIQKLDVSSIPNLDEVSKFTAAIKTLLETSKNLLPNEAPAIDEVLSVVNVVTGLPTLDTVKADILSLIDAIVVHLTSLKPTA